VAGHSHKAAIRKCGKVLFVNPGSAGPRRFRLSVTLAMLVVRTGRIEASVITLA
jgi:predicted phosphodiesterase